MANRGEIRSLTTLRGVAALSVAIFHTPLLFGFKALLPHAYLAVDFFFILSGFVLTHAYAERVGTGLGFGRFSRLRFARLYPLYLFATAAGAALVALRVAAHTLPFDPRGWAQLPLGLLLAPSPATPMNPEGIAYPFVKQGWSLAWELVGGSLLFLWMRHGLKREVAAVGATLLLLVAVMWRRDSLDGGWQAATFWIGGVRALYGFAAGLATRRVLLPLLQGASERVLRRLDLATAAIGLGALAYVAAAPTSLAVELALVVYVFPLVIAMAALRDWAVLRARLGVAVGHASYSLYLLHIAAGLATVMALARLPHLPTPAMHLVGPLWMAGLTAACWFCWRFGEEPARAWLSQPHRRPRRSLRSAVRAISA